MTVKKLYPMIVCKDLGRTRAFYVGALGCRVVFDMPDYLHVAFGEGEDAPELSFSTPNVGEHFGFECQPHDGKGLIISIPVEDVDAEHVALRAKGVAVASPPADRPWEWRSFVVTDPEGVMLDFCRPLAQAAAVDATG